MFKLKLLNFYSLYDSITTCSLNIFSLAMFHPEIVTQIISFVGTKEKADQILNYSKKIYDLHQFNIGSLYPKDVKKMNESLKRRYKRQQIQILPTNWNQGQRRLFIWFIVCFLYLKRIDLEEITQSDLVSLSDVFYGKEAIFLDFQLKNLPKSNKGKRGWALDQDQLLKKAIKELKGQSEDSKVFNNWNDVAKIIFFQTERKVFKTPKSCRERWYNHVDESKKKDEFSIEEDLILINYILVENKSWSKIVKILNYSRTEHRIKNRYYTLIRKYQRNTGSAQQLSEQNQKEILLKLKEQFEAKTGKKVSQQKFPQSKDNIQDLRVKLEEEVINDQFFEQSELQNKFLVQENIISEKLKTESSGQCVAEIIKCQILQESQQSEKSSNELSAKQNSKGTLVNSDQFPPAYDNQALWGQNYIPAINYYQMGSYYNGNFPENRMQQPVIINQFYCPIILQNGPQYQYLYQN